MGRVVAEQALIRHPASSGEAAIACAVTVAAAGPKRLVVDYVVTGDVQALLVPPLADSVRTDALWEHLCFELFIGGAEPGYVEFNFSPSTQWAAYRFSGYRAGIERLMWVSPEIASTRHDRTLIVNVALDLGAITLPETWHVGLSAVTEEVGGAKAFWALAHPPGPPDFHHADCFALDLAAPAAP